MRIYDVTDESDVKFYGRDSLYNDPANEVLANGNGTGDVAVKEEANGEFTIFWLATNNGLRATRTGTSILPVNLVSFTAGMVNNEARLTWKTSAENNNLGFDIERSSNGIDFNKIGFVASLAPDGNSKLPLDYSFTDKTISGNRNFYRLKQLDKDNVATYSSIQVVDAKSEHAYSVTVRNNPIIDQVSLSIKSAEKTAVTVSLVNPSGSVLQNVSQGIMPGETIINMPASHLPKGIYFVTVRDNENPGSPVTIKIMK
jgi:ABC-type multidrug transport system fused ATPase/permease subunit